MPSVRSRSDPSCFVKVYARDHDAELLKARWFHDVARAGGFRAPRVLDADPDRRTITYEWLPCSYSLQDLMDDPSVEDGHLRQAFRHLGRVLAAIHHGPPFDQVQGRRADGYQRTLLRLRAGQRPTNGPLVPQHGDFGYSNIYFGADRRPIVIDPSPNGYTSVHPLNEDHPEVDLALLMSHLVGRTRRPRVMARTARLGGVLARDVLDGYRAEGGAIDRDELRLHTRATVDSFRRSRDRSRRLLLPLVAGALERNLP